MDENEETTNQNKILIALACFGLFAIGWFASSLGSGNEENTNAQPVEQSVAVDEPEECDVDCLSEDQISALCATDEEEPQTEELKQPSATEILQSTQDRVKELEETLKQKEKELKKLRKESQKDPKAKEAARRKWLEMEAEVEILRSQLEAAVSERDELRKELKVTLKKLDKQVKKTKKYKAKAKKYKKESVKNLWKAFSEDGKRRICDRGSKRRHVKCWEAVQEALTSGVRSKFETCVNTYQAVPVLQKNPKFFPKDSDLPPFSAWLNKKSKFTKKWYIVYCDPTLPEKKDKDLDDDDEDLTSSAAQTNKSSDDDNTTEDLENFEIDLDLD